MEIPYLQDIIIIFSLSIAVLFICHQVRIPAIVGFIITGLLIGPHGLAVVKSVDEVEILADIGIVFLLFAIGIEFSVKKLLNIKKSAILGGSLQVFITILVTYFIARKLGFQFDVSVFLGFLIALSSTAIVLTILQSRAEIDSPHGRTAFAILIFQDIIIVPMMLFTPYLSGMTGDAGISLLILALKGTGIILLVYVSAKWIVPKLLYQITRTRIRELFLLVIFVICLATVWITSSAGLSLALGAFLAGLIISNSDYSHHALSNVLPFRDIFISFFFISIGMLLDIRFIIMQPVFIGLVALSVLALKTIIAGSITLLLGYPLRTGILVGLTLSQVGEFSFILSKTGIDHGLLSGDNYQLFLSVSVLTMAATPFIIALAPKIADSKLLVRLPGKLKTGLFPKKDIREQKKQDHLIIIGYGVNGRNLARAAKAANIPYTIIEMNPDTVRTEKGRGEPIQYGDATNESLLKNANIKEAKILVVAISDPTATNRITRMARQLNPTIYIIVRTRFIQRIKPLYTLGADEVIPEEFETSIEIFTRVLMKYLVPGDEINKFISDVRSDSYEMFRSASFESSSLQDFNIHLPEVKITTIRVGENSSFINQSLSEIKLREVHGVTVLAIQRDLQVLSNPDANTKIQVNDILVLLGKPKKIAALKSLS
jgi:CPA2 family monovalent cation:H+ antiporter-2